jgi:hypothetical protein
MPSPLRAVSSTTSARLGRKMQYQPPRQYNTTCSRVGNQVFCNGNGYYDLTNWDSASCRSRCAKPTSHGCSSGVSPAYSSLSTSRVKSPGTYSTSPAVWASKASSRSAVIAPIPPGNAGTG